MSAVDPRWLAIARRYLGVSEIPGPRHNPTILGWLHRLRSWVADDETPWCGLFVAAVMDEAGLPVARNYLRARAWMDWGTTLALPAPGCVVVFERGPTMGHVGFVVGRDADGQLLVLGGNQGNAVTIAAFARSRVLPGGYRWPAAEPILYGVQLPVGSAARSTSEA
jgi:uncharacterized protein (TIGR02594 family)